MQDEAAAETRDDDELLERGKGTARSRKPAGRGGKLGRSETVTVRLDPKLNYLCELAARAQRRTKSSFIEWAIEAALSSVDIPGEVKDPNDGELWTINDRNADLWDVDEADRLVALAAYAPSLLTHEEQIFWKIVLTSPYLWRGRWWDNGDEEFWMYDTSRPYNVMLDRLRENWDSIRRVADGSEPRDENFMLKRRLVKGQTLLTKTVTPTPAHAFDDDLDSDVPF